MSSYAVHIGHGNFVPAEKVLAILSRDTRSVKPMISRAELNKKLINATMGRKIQSVILTTDNFVVLSSITPKTIAERFPEEGFIEILDIGGGNFIPHTQINAILQRNSEPIKNMLKLARAQNQVVNSQMGKRMKAIISTSHGYFFLSFLSPKTLHKRFEGKESVLKMNNTDNRGEEFSGTDA